MITLIPTRPAIRLADLVPGLAFALLGLAVGVHPVVTASLAIAGVAAVIDARTGVLPDPVVALAAAPAACFAVSGLVGGAAGTLWASLAGAAALTGPLLAAHLVSPASLGFGDVKLGAALGVALGLVDPRLGFPALCVATGGSALWAMGARRSSVALGPGLVCGSVAAVVAERVGGGLWR